MKKKIFYLHILLYFVNTFTNIKFYNFFIPNKKIKLYPLKKIINRSLMLSNFIYLINAYTYFDLNSEKYIISLIMSFLLPFAYYFYCFKKDNGKWYNIIDHNIALIILIVFKYKIKNFKLNKHSLTILIIMIYYFFIKKHIYNNYSYLKSKSL